MARHRILPLLPMRRRPALPTRWNLPLLAPLVLAPLAAAEDEASERLVLALDGVVESDLAADLRFLASDEMGGRDTPSPELLVSALFLRARLERLGFQAPPGGFLQDYPLHTRGIDDERSGLWLSSTEGERRLSFAADYVLARSSHLFDSDLAGPVVCVDTGSRDAFAGADLEGAWALLFDRGASMRQSLRNAERSGALGVLFVQSPHDTDPKKPYLERFGATARRMQSPQPGYRLSPPREADGPVAVMLSPEGAAALLELSPHKWSGLLPPSGLALDVRAHEVRMVAGERIGVPNVVGLWPGDDPELSREVIVVSAHYDHVGRNGSEVFNGADDNASGTVGLLGVAEALRRYGPLRRTVALVWLSGEEKGLWGSHAWANAPTLPEGHGVVADLNIDMIGRTEPDELYLTPTRDHEAYNTLAAAAYDQAVLEGFPELRSQDRDWNRSDHFNFHNILGVPVAFLSAGEHPDYHEPTDTADKIDFGKLARITRVVVRMLVQMQDRPIEAL